MRVKSVLLFDLHGLFPDHEIRADSMIVRGTILEGVKIYYNMIIFSNQSGKGV